MDTQDYLEQGQEYSLQADYERAITAYDEAIRLAPAEAAAYYGRGYCLTAKGDHDRAIADFTEAMRLDPGLLANYSAWISKAYCERATAHCSRNEYEQAVKAYTSAIQFQPRSISFPGYIWYLRGCCHAARGDHGAAVDDYDEALRLGYTGFQDCVIKARAAVAETRQAKHS